MTSFVTFFTERHARLKRHRRDWRELVGSLAGSNCFCLALSPDESSEYSVSAVCPVCIFISYLWWLVDGASYGFILGMVRNGFARSFLFGSCRPVCHGWSSLKLAPQLCDVSFSSRSIHRQYRLLRLGCSRHRVFDRPS